MRRSSLPLPFPWQDIDTVLLDMDGTLLDLNFDNHFWLHHFPRTVAELKNRALEDIEAKLFTEMQRTRGTLAWYSTDYWSEFMDVDVMQIKRKATARIAIRDNADDMLGVLRANNKRLVLVTNAHPDVLRLKCDITGIDRFFHRLISSHDLGAPKEDPAFWQALQQTEDFDVTRTLFVDDSVPVLKAARAFGIAWLLAPATPDSRRPPAGNHGFATIASFDDILP